MNCKSHGPKHMLRATIEHRAYKDINPDPGDLYRTIGTTWIDYCESCGEPDLPDQCLIPIEYRADYSVKDLAWQISLRWAVTESYDWDADRLCYVYIKTSESWSDVVDSIDVTEIKKALSAYADEKSMATGFTPTPSSEGDYAPIPTPYAPTPTPYVTSGSGLPLIRVPTTYTSGSTITSYGVVGGSLWRGEVLKDAFPE